MPTISFNNKPEAPQKMKDESFRVEIMLARAEQADMKLESDIAERFGTEFSHDAQSRLKTWTQSFLAKGDDAIDWIEVKGLPLPKSKLGMRMLGGAMGVTGSVVPGLGILLPLAYILWKRSNDLSTATNLEKQYASR